MKPFWICPSLFTLDLELSVHGTIICLNGVVIDQIVRRTVLGCMTKPTYHPRVVVIWAQPYSPKHFWLELICRPHRQLDCTLMCWLYKRAFPPYSWHQGCHKTSQTLCGDHRTGRSIWTRVCSFWTLQDEELVAMGVVRQWSSKHPRPVESRCKHST